MMAERGVPPEAWRGAHQVKRAVLEPIERFLHIQAASGIVLVVVAVIAMLWANSGAAESYRHFWHTAVRIGIGSFAFERDLHFWINDGLMVIFFFVVGLEIRREIHSGELQDLKRASLPITAALGGMVAPALIYVAIAGGAPEARSGWGVPMATDIAFAVGVLALLGDRVPPALRVLLLALAIIDDIGAILVIAIFYSGDVSLAGLAIAGGGVLLTLAMQRFGVRAVPLYVAPGVIVWAGMVVSGIHPTIAGVIMGLITPVRPWFGREGLVEEAGAALREIETHDLGQRELLGPLDRIATAGREAVSPVVRLESALHPYVAFLIMPLFALANAGVTVGQVDLSLEPARLVAAGVLLGLVAGKAIGIVGASWVAVKLGLSAFPRGVDGKNLIVVGLVGGIGFTMSLFLADLAFTDDALLQAAKLSVLVGSCAAGVIGLAAGRFLLERRVEQGAARTVAEAERSTEK